MKFARDEEAWPDGIPAGELVFALASATGRDVNEWGGNDEWWSLDMSISQSTPRELDEDNKWANAFSFTFVGMLPIADANAYVRKTYDHDHNEDVKGYRPVETSELRFPSSVPKEILAGLDLEYEEDWLGGIRSDEVSFRPEYELGGVWDYVVNEGYILESIWYVKAETGPDPGDYLLEFRAAAVWQDPSMVKLR